MLRRRLSIVMVLAATLLGLTACADRWSAVEAAEAQFHNACPELRRNAEGTYLSANQNGNIPVTATPLWQCDILYHQVREARAEAVPDQPALQITEQENAYYLAALYMRWQNTGEGSQEMEAVASSLSANALDIAFLFVRYAPQERPIIERNSCGTIISPARLAALYRLAYDHAQTDECPAD